MISDRLKFLFSVLCSLFFLLCRSPKLSCNKIYYKRRLIVRLCLFNGPKFVDSEEHNQKIVDITDRIIDIGYLVQCPHVVDIERFKIK